jgi:hypothetical protein
MLEVQHSAGLSRDNICNMIDDAITEHVEHRLIEQISDCWIGEEPDQD